MPPSASGSPPPRLKYPKVFSLAASRLLSCSLPDPFLTFIQKERETPPIRAPPFFTEKRVSNLIGPRKTFTVCRISFIHPSGPRHPPSPFVLSPFVIFLSLRLTPLSLLSPPFSATRARHRNPHRPPVPFTCFCHAVPSPPSTSALPLFVHSPILPLLCAFEECNLIPWLSRVASPQKCILTFFSVVKLHVTPSFSFLHFALMSPFDVLNQTRLTPNPLEIFPCNDMDEPRR